MLTVILQILASAALLVLLGSMVWRLRLERRAVYVLLGLGFAGRAVAGQILFWVSYLELPFGRSLQLGDGLWFFARDAVLYAGAVKDALNAGWQHVALVDRTLPSPFYVQVLAIFTAAVGQPVMAGLLVNLFAYTATGLVVVRLARRAARPEAGVFAVAALAFSPSGVLWSLQPLKDTLFVLLIFILLYGFVRWQGGWKAPRGPRRRVDVLVALVVCCAATYMLAGIRWYFPVLALVSAAPLIIGCAISLRGRELAVYALVSLVLVVLLSQAIVVAATPYLPAPIRNLVEGKPSQSANVTDIGESVERARSGFDASGGATIIKTGKVLSESVAAPPTRRERLAAGLIALLVPPHVGSSFGLISLGDGRGLLFFADVDTVFFLGVTLMVVLSMRRNPEALRAPTFWQVALLAVMLAVALAYTVSNFGTLFRHRGMVFACVVALPLVHQAVARQRQIVP